MIYLFHLLVAILVAQQATSQWTDGPYNSSVTGGPACRVKELTSFTLVKDYLDYWTYSYSTERLLNRIANRFPCGIKQYTSVTIKNTEISEYITHSKEDFIGQISYSEYSPCAYYMYNPVNYCNQSLLYGLKEALLISPPGSFVLVLTDGTISDANDTALLNDIYSLLETKQSQVFFMVYWYMYGYEPPKGFQNSLLQDIASRSYGHVSSINLYNIWGAIHGLDLFLTKPVNASVRILNINVNASGEIKETFNTTALTHLLVYTSGDVNITLIDPNGNDADFVQSLSYSSGHSYLVKHPVLGQWTLNLNCKGFIYAMVLGFTGSSLTGKCSDSDCHPNATCEEFGGYQECTCKKGFTGDGFQCYDINECGDYWLTRCNGYCENTEGSYNCTCYGGMIYTEEGCVDIDECSSKDLNNCHPLAVCTNYWSWYSCSCPHGYFGDGFFCEVNECQQGTPCDPNTECNKYIGHYTCLDPCSNHTVLDDPWRSLNNKHTGYYYYDYYWSHCDNYLSGWYRFQGKTDQKIPEYCIAEQSCGTSSPIWLNGTHPTQEEGIVNVTTCSSWGDCCYWNSSISIKACPGDFYVYKLTGTPSCNSAYCVEPNQKVLNCSSLYCSHDEECRKENGVLGCYCKYSDVIYGDIQEDYPLPELTCSTSLMKLSYSKCLLEKMGMDTLTIHLRDNGCKGYIEREDIQMVKIDMVPQRGFCGGQIKVNATHFTYINTVYVSPKSDDMIQRGEIALEVFCSYERNMQVSLWTAINPVLSSVNISVGGTGSYRATMSLFQNWDYSMPYMGPEIWISAETLLYVGVMVEETKEPQFVLQMKDCYATPTSDSGHPVKYYIIKNNCPNVNDPTVFMEENGISLSGKFSVQLFKFIGYNTIFLHCQIRLCDKSTEICIPVCRVKSSSTDNNNATHSLTLGPIYNTGAGMQPVKQPAANNSNGAAVSSVTSLTLILYFLLLIFVC
ncbi:uromodulin-like [Xenopus laevis]|uniref:Uromodulin-like n=1 Tax=Xenopus laevis TaxID=8355 RepID=A0A8J1M0C8_XENLA|nr:uromodulin-like [Xenopus laevis]